MAKNALKFVDGDKFITTGFSSVNRDVNRQLKVVDMSKYVTTGIIHMKGGEKIDGIYQSREGNDVP